MTCCTVSASCRLVDTEAGLGGWMLACQAAQGLCLTPNLTCAPLPLLPPSSPAGNTLGAATTQFPKLFNAFQQASSLGLGPTAPARTNGISARPISATSFTLSLSLAQHTQRGVQWLTSNLSSSQATSISQQGFQTGFLDCTCELAKGGGAGRCGWPRHLWWLGGL